MLQLFHFKNHTNFVFSTIPFRIIKDPKNYLVNKFKYCSIPFVACACLANSRPFRIRSNGFSVNSWYSGAENAYNYYIVGIICPWVVTFTLFNGSNKTIELDSKEKSVLFRVVQNSIQIVT